MLAQTLEQQFENSSGVLGPINAANPNISR
jgi:hypothetical protein